MSQIEIKNAIIKDITINDGERGLLTAYLYLDYGSSQQGFGGYTLYLGKDYASHKDGLKINFAGHFIFRCMEIGEVTSWDKLKGKTIRVKAEHSKVHAIGHIVKNDWFNPEEDFEKFKSMFK